MVRDYDMLQSQEFLWIDRDTLVPQPFGDRFKHHYPLNQMS